MEDVTVFYITLDNVLNPGEIVKISMHYKAFVPELNARYGHQTNGGNNYEKKTDEVDGIITNTYFHKNSAYKGNEAIEVTKKTIKDMNYRLGKYPYSTFSVVELYMEMQGMEEPQMVFVTHEDVGVPTILHETIHEWFYNL